MTIEDSVRQFVAEKLAWDGREELTDDFPLIKNHVLDSMGILRLVTFLERQYRVSIHEEELVPEHFGTISDIARLVAAKMALGA